MITKIKHLSWNNGLSEFNVDFYSDVITLKLILWNVILDNNWDVVHGNIFVNIRNISSR